ncbi:MAG: hypothetical protein VX252_17825 [Myxococcota bacterium]|nr:hypothetical protein [Myxococcota bacterium]
MKVQSAQRILYPFAMRGLILQTTRVLLVCALGFWGLACTHAEKKSDPAAENVPIFDPSKFIICRSQSGVSEYTYALSLSIRDRVLDLVRPPIDESAKLALRLDENGNLVSVEVRSATTPSFGPIAAAAAEMAAPYPPPPEALTRCLVGKNLEIRVSAQAEARCENLEQSTEWVLLARDQIAEVVDSPAYMAEPGAGYGYLRLLFGPNGEIQQSQVYEPSNPQVADKIRRALAQIGPLSTPPDWETCFREQPVTLKIEAWVEEP